jgi:hypothetical protein
MTTTKAFSAERPGPTTRGHAVHDIMDMRGDLRLILTDRHGVAAIDRRQPNRIVTSGRRLVAEMFGGQTTGLPRTPVTRMAVGTGSATASDGDTALGAQRGSGKPITKVEYGEFNDAGSVKRVRVQLTTQFGFAEANDASTPLREAGLFNDAGVLYSRVVFEPVTKTDTFELTLLWEIVF